MHRFLKLMFLIFVRSNIVHKHRVRVISHKITIHYWYSLKLTFLLIPILGIGLHLFYRNFIVNSEREKLSVSQLTHIRVRLLGLLL